MEIFIWVLYITLALFLGSFINVITLWLTKNESILLPPSQCQNCKHRLNVVDLIPLFSFIRRVRCRHCDTKVSLIIFFGELITLLFLLLIPIYQDLSIELFVAYPFALLLIIAMISDLKYKIIPNKLTYSGIILILLLRVFIHPIGFWNYLIGAFIGGGFLLLLAILSNGGIGGGDIKLFFLIGLVLGWQNTLLALLISSFIGAVIGGILILFGLIKRKQLVPFGPSITFGAMITYLFGTDIWNWYLSILFGR